MIRHGALPKTPAFNDFNFGPFMQVTGNMIEDTDKKVISQIQKDLSVHPEPFAVMAEKIGISEGEFIKRVKRLKETGIIRRFGATTASPGSRVQSQCHDRVEISR